MVSDVVGAKGLWEAAPDAMKRAMARHDELVADAVERAGGVPLKGRGDRDVTTAAFARPSDAVHAAFTLQVALANEEWPAGARIRVRFAVDARQVLEGDGDAFGQSIDRAVGLLAVADAGEVVVSASTAPLVVDHLPAGCRLVSLGPLRLRDLDRSEAAYVLTGRGLPEPVPRAGDEVRSPPSALPDGGVTRREAEVLRAVREHLSNAEIAARLRRDRHVDPRPVSTRHPAPPALAGHDGS